MIRVAEVVLEDVLVDRERHVAAARDRGALGRAVATKDGAEDPRVHAVERHGAAERRLRTVLREDAAREGEAPGLLRVAERDETTDALLDGHAFDREALHRRRSGEHGRVGVRGLDDRGAGVGACREAGGEAAEHGEVLGGNDELLGVRAGGDPEDALRRRAAESLGERAKRRSLRPGLGAAGARVDVDGRGQCRRGHRQRRTRHLAERRAARRRSPEVERCRRARGTAGGGSGRGRAVRGARLGRRRLAACRVRCGRRLREVAVAARNGQRCHRHEGDFEEGIEHWNTPTYVGTLRMVPCGSQGKVTFVRRVDRMNRTSSKFT